MGATEAACALLGGRASPLSWHLSTLGCGGGSGDTSAFIWYGLELGASALRRGKTVNWKSLESPSGKHPVPSGLQMEACYWGLHKAEVWSLALRGLGYTKGSFSTPRTAGPSCSWSTSNLEVLCCAQRPPPPPLPTTTSKQDHAVVAGVTSDAPDLQPRAGRQLSGKVYFWGSGFLPGRSSVPTFPPHPVWPPDRVLRSRGWRESSGCGR